MWSPFLAKTSLIPKGAGIHWRVVHDWGSSSKDFSLHICCFLSLSLIPSPSHSASLFFSLSFFLASSEFVNSPNDWFRDRRAVREGESVVISKLPGILCLVYESWTHRFRGGWCEYADVVVWDSTSAAIRYTARGTQSSVFEATCPLLLNTKTNTTLILNKPNEGEGDSILTNTIHSTVSCRFIR